MLTGTSGEAALLPVYAQMPVRPVSGSGSWITDESGHRWLDAYGGHVVAVDNLERVAKSPGFNATLCRTKSDQHFVAWHGNWLAASCCQLPYLYKLVRRQLATDRLCLSIPHRGTMLLFPQGDQASRDEMRSVIQKLEGQAPEQLTFELFCLQADGVSAFYEDD